MAVSVWPARPALHAAGCVPRQLPQETDENPIWPPAGSPVRPGARAEFTRQALDLLPQLLLSLHDSGLQGFLGF